ncbi:MAG: hypothetical protein KIS66_06920 [Fimbriimonadaceae bacterium]|nr:hypothetical protein [Fimbriimonadaceae bacterium]
MPTTNYHTVNGRTIGETTDGVRTDYLTDALGSVTATVDQSQNVLNTYRYKPYGGLLAKTGSSPDPKFLWTGDTGSRTTGLAYFEQYNRARHYGSMQAGWTSVDPLWPRSVQYGYAFADPLRYTDPGGMLGIDTNCTCKIIHERTVCFSLAAIRHLGPTAQWVLCPQWCYTEYIKGPAPLCRTGCQTEGGSCSGRSTGYIKITHTPRSGGRAWLDSECIYSETTTCRAGFDWLAIAQSIAGEFPVLGSVVELGKQMYLSLQDSCKRRPARRGLETQWTADCKSPKLAKNHWQGVMAFSETYRCCSGPNKRLVVPEGKPIRSPGWNEDLCGKNPPDR